jgi:hypothetical protein
VAVKEVVGFNLDHVWTLCGQQHGAVRPDDAMAEVEHPNIGKWQGLLAHEQRAPRSSIGGRCKAKVTAFSSV